MSEVTEEQGGEASRQPRMALASFFIHRPVFAIVVAIVISLAGILGITTLPISQYPDIAPTTIRISATYSGATAEAVQNSVTTTIEDSMTGLSGLLYMQSSSRTGSSSISLVFNNSVDPDIAQVQVQNKLSLVESQLPDSVQDAGLSVNRSGTDIMMIGAIVSEDDSYTTQELSDIMTSQIEPQIERINGVGGVQAFGSEYAMRIWLDPMSLAQYSLTPSDVASAVEAQNTQVSVGTIGELPVTDGQQLEATVTAQSQLQTAEEFKNIILVSEEDGSIVRLGDVARVELGFESYGMSATYNGKPAGGFGVELASGANAITVANSVHAELDSLQKGLPDGVKVVYAYETTPFVTLSIEKVVHTLIEAIILVFVVLLLFLQNFRATFIPMIAVPVVLLGTFGVLAVFGYSINMLTMFAMVLAIGLLVDDAIVVVENVERIMREEGLSPMEATEKSMGEITGALIGIAMVLTAVFIPMAFFSGSVGVIYRQFSVTIASAMLLSVLVAIVLTPALCAMMLSDHDDDGLGKKLFGWFDKGFNKFTGGYVGGVRYVIKRPLRMIVLFLVLLGGAYWMYKDIPSSFVPQEDQGVLMAMIRLPNGANADRTAAVVKHVKDYFLNDEKDSVDGVFMVSGWGFSGSASNSAMGFIKLKDFDERTDPNQKAQAIAVRALAHFQELRDGDVFVLAPPAISGLGQSDGFEMYMEDTSNKGSDALQAAANKLATMADDSGVIDNFRGNTTRLSSQLKVDIDQEKAGALGVDLSAANSLLNTIFSGDDVNDFIYNGEIKEVIIQGDAAYRMQPEDIGKWFISNDSGEMVPFSAFSTTKWEQSPASLARFNGVDAIQLSGSAASGVSSGTAMDEMESLVNQLNEGYSVSWSGLSYQEQLSGNQANMLYAVSLLVVFLCLAALYESWSIPFSVLLTVPVGLLGALAAAYFFNQSNDVYFKVGLLTTMGLTAKNAILIVEFAKDSREQGMGLIQSILHAAHMRIRPIMMTSIAFILGVLPLAFATGAGSGAQNAIGIGVMGGMLAATVLGIFFVPMFFVLIAGGWRKKHREEAEAQGLY